MFGAPWWLLGALAGAGPIIIHLLNRQRFQRVTWAAMEWLLRALERNRRRIRVENLILLAVRVAVLVLLALALAQPMLEPGGALSLAGGTRVCRIFVLDDSYSMSAGGSSENAFERARKAADDILAASTGGDVASLVVAGTESGEIVPEPTSDIAHVREQVNAATLSHREVNIPAVLARVAAAADHLPHPRLALYVLTDMQRSSWLSDGKIRDHTLADALGKIRRKARVFLVDLEGREFPNTAVSRLALSADDSGETQGLVAVDAPVTVRATLEHFAAEPRAECAVRLAVNGQIEGRKVVTLDPRKPATVQFAGVAFRTSGPHVVRVEVDADALTLDDSRELAVDVERELRVLCVNGAPSGDLVSNETYFLERALAPQQFEFAEGGSVFAVDTVSDVDFLTRNLNSYRLVVLANVFQVAKESLPQIEAFVRRGGGLILFPGDRVESEAYNRVLYQDGHGLLPARIMERKSFPPGGREFSRFRARPGDHEVLRTLADRNVDVSIARVFEYFYLKPTEGDPGVRVLFRYDNPEMSAAAVEKHFGQGLVVLMSTSATTRWSTFPLSPAFAPFLQELASYACGGSAGQRNLTVGEPIRTVLFPGEFGTSVTVLKPGKERVERSPAPEGEAFRFDFPDTRYAGVYTVDFGGSKGKMDYCVTLDTRESDLERISKAELDAAVPDNPFVYVKSPEELRTATSRGETGTSIWKALVYATLGLLLLEALLAKVFGAHRGIVKRN